jgi:luciferase-like monooxygenase
MRLGLQIPNFSWPKGPAALAETLRRIATIADEGGFASVWVMDHFFQIPPVGPAETDMLEGYSALAHLAAVTRRVRLGTMVTGVTYRHPGVLVKTVTTLDVLSGGRAALGIGAAWFEREHRGLGVPFPPLAERFERLEEALRIAKQMWSGQVAPFAGRHYALAETLCVPQPLSRPHPHCDELGRDYDAIERTTLGSVHLAPGQQTTADVIRQCRELARVGVQQAIVNLPNVHEITPLERLAKEVIPELRES